MKRIPAELIYELLGEINIGLTFLTPAGEFIYRNQYAEKLMDSRGKSEKSVLECHNPVTHQYVLEQLKEVVQGKGNEWHRIFNAGDRSIENLYSSCDVGDETVVALISRDVTERERASQELKETLTELQILYDAAKILASSLDYVENFRRLLALMLKVFSFERVAIWQGNKVGELVLLCQSGIGQEERPVPQNVRIACQQKREAATCGTTWERAIPLEVRDEMYGVLDVHWQKPPSVALSRQKTLSSIVSLVSAALMNARRFIQTEKEASEDRLTGLYNRQQLNRAVSRLNKNRPVTVGAIMIDVNQLKKINDNYGHEAGDTVIRGAAEVLKRSTRRENIFRYGGDEFLILVENGDRQVIKTVLQRVQAELANWNKVHPGLPVALSLSIGWAAAKAQKISTIIRRADRKMYQDKQRFYASINT